MKEAGNWFDLEALREQMPSGKLSEEVFEDVLLGQKGFRLERIVSDGQASPEGFWYEQGQAEWVIVLQGEAGFQFEDEAEEQKLRVGDYVFIEAERKHRVSWTSMKEKTIWLAIYFDV